MNRSDLHRRVILHGASWTAWLVLVVATLSDSTILKGGVLWKRNVINNERKKTHWASKGAASLFKKKSVLIHRLFFFLERANSRGKRSPFHRYHCGQCCTWRVRTIHWKLKHGEAGAAPIRAILWIINLMVSTNGWQRLSKFSSHAFDDNLEKSSRWSVSVIHYTHWLERLTYWHWCYQLGQSGSPGCYRGDNCLCVVSRHGCLLGWRQSMKTMWSPRFKIMKYYTPRRRDIG